MSVEIPDNLQQLLEEWLKIDYILPKDIPNIELYMDQVITFMDNQLKGNKRYEEDKTLTKTMVNNYSKNNLLPSSNKKKYSKNHILVLIYIYYFKNILSITDIQKLLNMMNEKFFDSDDELNNLSSIYEKIFVLERENVSEIKNSVDRIVEKSKDVFEVNNKEDEDFLNNFALISLLNQDIYMKKKLVEKMLDNFYKEDTKKSKDKKEK